jgi:hypothetical protein
MNLSPGILVSHRRSGWQVDATTDLWSHPDLDPMADNYPENEGQTNSAGYFQADSPEEASKMFIQLAQRLSVMKGSAE